MIPKLIRQTVRIHRIIHGTLHLRVLEQPMAARLPKVPRRSISKGDVDKEKGYGTEQHIKGEC